MKKSLKTQMKKSISLFLAVLMILSCWVWVAPEKASADHTTGQYYFKWVIGKINEAGNSGNWKGNTLTINYVKTDGTTGTKTVALDKSKYNSEGKTNQVIWEGYIDGFPTSAGWYMEMEWQAAASVYLDADDCTYYVGKDATSCTHAVSNTDSFKWQNNAVGQGTTKGTFTLNSEADKEPYIKYASAVSTLNTNESNKPLTIPVVTDTETEILTSYFKPEYWDQYDVKWIGATDPEYQLYEYDSEMGLIGSDKVEAGIYLDKNSNTKMVRAKIDYRLQKSYPASGTTKDFYIVASVENRLGNTVKVTRKITVTYPEYTVSVDPKGGSMVMSDNQSQQTVWTNQGVYNKSPEGSYPTGDAERTGYTFLGFWAAPQPEYIESFEKVAFDATVNAYESDMVVPVTSKEFEDYCSKENAVKNGNYVTVGSKTYYNAGQLWDKATSRNISGNQTYYAWWLAKDISVKFYDIDGTFLTKITYKYGLKLSDKTSPTPTDSYTSGAFTYNAFTGAWSNINGTLVDKDFKFGSDGLYSYTLTPTYSEKTYKDSYKITFVKPDGSETTDTYEYRHILKGGEILNSVDVPESLRTDLAYSYNFKGWTTQKPASGNYIIVDNNDTIVVINEDWIVRNDATYYPVFERTIKSYVVRFYYLDITGSRLLNKDIIVKYGSLLTTPEDVDITYATGGMSYNILQWGYTNSENESTYMDIDKSIVFNSENVHVTDANIAGGTPIIFTAEYDDGTKKPYDIVFVYKDINGKDNSLTVPVTHGSKISDEIVKNVKNAVPEKYDNGSALYTFSNSWRVVEGTASNEAYSTASLTSFAPTSNVVFEAIYDEGVPFYTVTYIDGAAKYTDRVLQGSNLPAWMLNNGEYNESGELIQWVYVPKDYETPTGIYKFAGWFNKEQTDEDYSQTNGKEYTTSSPINEADVVDGVLTLYPQYIYEAYRFKIEFVGFDGKVLENDGALASGEFEVNESFEAIYNIAEIAARNRAADETYSYTFIGWDSSTGNLVCDGKPIRFTARYRSNYIYYQANWYNSVKDINENKDPLAKTQHTFGSSVYNPSVDLVVPDGYVFDGWYYSVNGVEEPFVRGMAIEGEMKFYAKYEKAAEIYTVTTIVNGTSSKYEVAEKGTASAIVAPEYIFVGEYTDENGEIKNGHKKFDGWYEDADYNTPFDLNKEITSSITVYAKYEIEPHTFITEEITADPTYYNVGSKIVYCVCDKTTTRHPVEISMLTDTEKPTGAIQLGSHKWSSTDENGAAATDNDEVSIFANADTDIIITVNDTGDVEYEYNPGGIGKGIALIKAFAYPAGVILTTENYGEAMKAAIEVYKDQTEALNNTANYVFRLSDMVVAVDNEGNILATPEKLKDGEEYIVYYYVNDKAGNYLNVKVRTAKFVYDISAPKFSIDGNNNGTNVPTYCGEAIVTGIKADETITVNGKVVTATFAEGAKEGTYVINEANNYVITVTDRAGNQTSKKIKVADKHNNIETIVNSTCTENGYKKVVCAVCGFESVNETYTTTGHEWKPSIVPATCEENGYFLNTCEICGETEIIAEDDGEIIYPALGHVYPTTEDGKIVYTIETYATCVADGLMVAKCTYCDGGVLSEKIDKDTDNGHSYGSVKTLKPTCTEAGMTYQRCKYCNEILKGQTIDATGHKETYSVIASATCSKPGSETEYCKKCGVEVKVTTIAATGKHIFVATDDCKEPTGTEEGYITYACKTCGATKVKTIDKLEVFDVTFVAEDGETVIVALKDIVKDSTISEDVLKGENDASLIPVKASDNEYNYTFVGWVDENGKTVKLPFDVSGDITLKATYKATRRIYSHQFMVPTDWVTTLVADEKGYTQYGDILIGYYGDTNKKPNTIPKFTHSDPEEDKKLKKKYTFTFLGWSTSGAEGDIVDFTNTPMIDNDTFYAVFKAELNEYNVIFSKKNGDLLWMTSVSAGSSVQYGGSNPAYYDDNFHYTFNKWLLGTTEYAYDATINDIVSDTKLVVDYTKTAHKFTTVEAESWEPTCYREGQLTEICECGYIKVTAKPMIDHNYSNVADENGKLVCKNEGCDHSIDAEAKLVTITFIVDGKEVSVQVAEGDTYKFTAPEKESSVSHDYPFNAWFKDDEEYSKSQTITVTAGSKNETYVASYGETIRQYRVTYFDWNHDIFVDNNGNACTGLYEYGSQIPAKPAKTPSRAYDTTFHYVFTGWQVVAGSAENKKVEGDIEYYATYSIIKHNFVENTEDATCTKVGGKTMACDCGYSYATGSVIPMIPHTEGTVLEKTEATIYGDGVYRYICASCGEEQKEVVPMLEKTNIAIRVYDGEGKKAAYVTVKVYYTVIENGQTTLVEYKTTTGYSYLTNADGFVNIVAPAGYKGWRASIYYNGGSYSGELKTGGEENVFGGPKVEEPESECGCTCHKSGLWGSFYRFIQKILRMFGAKPCCHDQQL